MPQRTGGDRFPQILRRPIMAKLRNAGFILIVVLFLALSWGCTADVLGGSASGALENGDDHMPVPNPGTFEGLSAELEKEIAQAISERYIIEVSSFPRYYGTYNGYVVIVPYYSPLAVVWSRFIDGIEFEEPSPPGIWAWKDGDFFFLHDLYEQGLLTREDLIAIAAAQYESRGMPL